jgi:hypothetical protein
LAANLGGDCQGGAKIVSGSHGTSPSPLRKLDIKPGPFMALLVGKADLEPQATCYGPSSRLPQPALSISLLISAALTGVVVLSVSLPRSSRHSISSWAPGVICTFPQPARFGAVASTAQKSVRLIALIVFTSPQGPIPRKSLCPRRDFGRHFHLPGVLCSIVMRPHSPSL